jgi:hypothetical protein
MAAATTAGKSLDERKSPEKYTVRELVKIAAYTDLPHRQIAGAGVAFFRKFSAFTGGALTMIASEEGDWIRGNEAAVTKEFERQLTGHGLPNAETTASSADANISAFELQYVGNFSDHKSHVDQGWVSCLQAWMPVEYFASHRAEVNQLIMDLIVLFPLSFAYASRSLEGSRLRRQQLVKRYLALDIAEVSSVAFDIGDKAAGAYWLTVYGRGLLDKVKERFQEAAAAGLPEGCRVAEGVHGTLMVLLGPDPIRGDVSRKESVAAYRWLAGLLDAAGQLHRPRYVRYFDEDEDDGLTDAEAQERWHTRFL